jgi:GxxExxY protein
MARMKMIEILHKELSYAVVGAAMTVHSALGPGFLESVYQKALAHELTLRQIPFAEQVPLPVMFKDVLVGDFYADFVVDDQVVLELKSAKTIHPRHKAQAANYLAASRLRLAIILNFGQSKLINERVAL